VKQFNKKLNLKIVGRVIVASLLLSNVSLAQLLTFQSISLQGNACKKSNTSVTISPDGTAISVLFNKFNLEFPKPVPADPNDLSAVDELVTSDLNGRNTRLVDWQTCNMTFELPVLEKTRIDEIHVSLDFRGLAALDPGLNAVFRSMIVYDTPNLPTPRTRKTLARNRWSNTNEDWIVSVRDKVSTALGCEPMLKRRFSIKSLMALSKPVVLPDPNAQALVTLDSTDAQFKGVSVSLTTSPCPSTGPGVVDGRSTEVSESPKRVVIRRPN